jgi:hypothetical protein
LFNFQVRAVESKRLCPSRSADQSNQAVFGGERGWASEFADWSTNLAGLFHD